MSNPFSDSYNLEPETPQYQQPITSLIQGQQQNPLLAMIEKAKQNAVMGQQPQTGLYQGLEQAIPQTSFADAMAADAGGAAEAGGMSGMQKAAMGAQVGGAINDMIMAMQTRAPTARGAQMNFGRQGPTISEQFRRGGR